MEEKMRVVSPIHGQVITWDLDKRLLDRPVTNGELLMEIADVDGNWKLELDVPGNRIGHLMTAMENSENGRLPISFLLAADPSKRLHGEVVEIGMSTDVTNDKKQILKLNVEIDDESIPVKHARTGVTAKIICGRSSIGYLWLHDVQEFFQKNVFFKFAN